VYRVECYDRSRESVECQVENLPEKKI
jgi:hypothetical protein